YRTQFAALRERLPGSDAAWMAELRARAIERFAATGFPTAKTEAWRYTSLNALQKVPFAPARAVVNGLDTRTVPTLLPDDAVAHRLVFVNGRLRPDLCLGRSLPEGITLQSLQQALAADPCALEGRLGAVVRQAEALPFADLNTALSADGYVLRLDDGARLERPLEILFVAMAGEQPLAWHHRNGTLAGPGSAATRVERHGGLGGGVYFANGVTEVAVQRDAEVRL